MKLPTIHDALKPAEKREVRIAYIHKQEGLCWFCKRTLEGPADADVLAKKIKPHLYPEGFFKHPVHLHHNHDTGLTVGAVHNYCNAVLWEYHGE